MQKNFNKNNFDACQLLTSVLKFIYVSVVRTYSEPLLDFTQTNLATSRDHTNARCYFRCGSLADSSSSVVFFCISNNLACTV